MKTRIKKVLITGLVLVTCSQISNAQESKKSTPVFEAEEGFTVLFDGTNLDAWIGNKNTYAG